MGGSGFPVPGKKEKSNSDSSVKTIIGRITLVSWLLEFLICLF